MANKAFRRAVRWLHLLVGAAIIVLIYSPLYEAEWYLTLIRVVAIPLVSLSGFTLWQQPKLLALFKGRRS